MSIARMGQFAEISTRVARTDARVILRSVCAESRATQWGATRVIATTSMRSSRRVPSGFHEGPSGGSDARLRNSNQPRSLHGVITPRMRPTAGCSRTWPFPNDTEPRTLANGSDPPLRESTESSRHSVRDSAATHQTSSRPRTSFSRPREEAGEQCRIGSLRPTVFEFRAERCEWTLPRSSTRMTNPRGPA